MHDGTVAGPDVGHEILFDLACPVAELDWIENWFFDLVHSDSGRNEEHCVFVEAMSAPFVLCNPGRTVWYTTLFDRETYRFHAMLTGESTLARFEFIGEELEDGRVRLRWDLTCTGLDERGDEITASPDSAGACSRC